MFKGQPKGLFALALANTGERFGYYTMLAIFLLFIQAKFGFSAAAATQIYSIFLAGVYFMPLIGGILADKIGYGKCVTLGIGVMFLGYLCLAIPTGAGIRLDDIRKNTGNEIIKARFNERGDLVAAANP